MTNAVTSTEQVAWRREGVFWAALAGLAIVPLVPEFVLWLGGAEDLKHFIPIIYYQMIVSFLLYAPALLLWGRWSRIWVAAMSAVMLFATLIVGFYTVRNGARWNLIAHTAMLQTNPAEAWSYLRTFASPGVLSWAGLTVLGTIGGVLLCLRRPVPRASHRWAVLALGLAGSAYGMYHAIRYNGALTRETQLLGGGELRVTGTGVNDFHPVTLLAATQYNYRATHQHYLAVYRQVDAQRALLRGATPVAGATPPRLIVLVIGESANRRHWSLYGYRRDTNPRLGAIRAQLTVFSDIIAVRVGTQQMIRAMLTTRTDGMPVFQLFSQAGFKTHWISAQYSQGMNDVGVTALTAPCDQRVFLEGAYDGRLIPLVARAAAEPGRQMIFVNMFGSHVRYADRYPADYAVFHGDTEKSETIAAYDNSIRYTDAVLADIIGELRARHESACLVYLSDHGEDVYDSDPNRYLFRDDSIATDPMYEVPFFVWLSPEYCRQNPGVAARVGAAKDRPGESVGLYNALIDLARLRQPVYDASRDILAEDYTPRERFVGVVHRLYVGPRHSPASEEEPEQRGHAPGQ